MRKIGFLVERATDEYIIEMLVKRVFPDTKFYAIPMGGKAGFHIAYPTVYLFLEKNYDHIILVVNSESTEREVANMWKRKYERQFRKYDVDQYTTVFAIEPDALSWLSGAEPIEEFGQKTLPKADIERLIATLDIDTLKMTNRNFRQFLQVVSKVVNQPKRMDATQEQ